MDIRRNVRGYTYQYYYEDKNCVQARISGETENMTNFDKSEVSSGNETSPAAKRKLSIFLLVGVTKRKKSHVLPS
jgi:hypothetical protein